jgi:hypothetical protein
LSEQEMKKRFQELVPWHVNGTLEPSEREWVDRYLRDHPEARAELRWWDSLSARIRENVPAVSAEVGMEKFMARIRAERPAPRSIKPMGMMERINEFFARLHLTPALAVAATLIVAQAGVIGGLLLQRSESDLSAVRTIGPAQIVTGPVVQVSFKPDVSERDMRSLLVSVNGMLVGGPGQLGNYLVLVPADKVKDAAQKIAASGLADEVSVLPHPPVRE